MYAGNTDNTTPQEGETKTLDLPDDDIVFVRRMMKYFYTLDYDPSPNSSSALALHAHMYILADKYNIDGLAKLATTNFAHGRDAPIYDPSCSNPKTALGHLLDIVPLVYDNIGSGSLLRQQLVYSIAGYLNASGGAMRDERYMELFKRYPDFGYESMRKGMEVAHGNMRGWDGDGWDSESSGSESEGMEDAETESSESE
ncbi:MAG: hypothetical protein Q9168_004265 [Polycauliona sp. 1 TL-2023]